MNRSFFVLFVFALLSPIVVIGYPDFIGYGYRSCMVCHESGAGGGSLTDYGRGVFASEIAANPFKRWMDDERAAEISNFLGAYELPFWLRLGYKYRTLSVERNPGTERRRLDHYNMQNDLNVNFYFSQQKTVSLISTIGYVENPVALYPNKTWGERSYLFWREYYLKAKISQDLWAYLGFMDKTFGLKSPNHTAFNRTALSLGQNDQVHSLLLQWAQKDRDVFVQGWAGNTHLKQELRRVGGSFMIDQKWGESNSWGVSLLSEKWDKTNQNLVAVHNKMGLGGGHSLLAEIGYRKEVSQYDSVQNEVMNNSYVWTQNMINLTRGYFFLSGMEAASYASNSSQVTRLRWELGFLMFPIQRFEYRITGTNQRSLNPEDVERDQWFVQSQLHLSL